MTKPRCPRLWEAEALEDGRLRDADRASFERHRMTCLECRSETVALDELRETFAALPAPTALALARHRVRASILREANRKITRVSGARRGVVVAILIAAAAVVLVLYRWPRPAHLVTGASTGVSPLTSSEGVASPAFEVRAESGSRWSTRARGSTTVIALEDGRASFEVAHLETGQRFLVAVPDGEVEVRGTKFTVDVASAATRAVEVASGRVALRLTGHEEIALGAGDRWRAPSVDDDRRVDAGRRDPALSADPPPHAAATKRHATDAGEQFDAAMRRFHAGEYAEADRQLAAFVREHGDDARSEDAAFLRAVARSRLGDHDAAAVLAARYLRAYPHGLRRAEAQQLVDAGAQ